MTALDMNSPASGRPIAALIAVLIVLTVSRGFAQTALPVDRTDRPTAASGGVRLSEGDLLTLDVFDTPELSSKVRISSDGMIALQTAGPIRLAGLTPAEAATVVERRLKDERIMLEPHVSIFVVEYATQGITVLGEVNRPGTYVLMGNHYLYEAIAAAGGVTAKQGSSITVTHRDSPETPLTVAVTPTTYADPERTTRVQPGDVVVVSRAPSIYVVGDVARPGEFPIQTGARLGTLKALALAAGLNRSAAAAKASIVRGTPDGATTIPVDLKRIAKNQAADPVLEPDDVLVVPRSGMRSFLEFALPNATSAVVGSVAAALAFR